MIWRAFGNGCVRVVTAPTIVIAAVLGMVIISLPFAAFVGSDLQEALSRQQPISRDAGEIDPEWWFEYRQHAGGLLATFTPAIIGFAAPLDNLSALLDGSGRPWAIAGPFIVAIVMWSFLWGAALDRYAGGGQGLWYAGARTFLRFLTISGAATAVIALFYLTIHQLLFSAAAPALEASAGSERIAFLWRSTLYAIFGALLVAVSVIVDYARVSIAVGRAVTAGDALREGLRFTRANPGSVVTLYLLTGALFVVLLLAYGAVDVYGGSRVGGWRGIAIAQGYIIARIVIRLTFGASEVQLYRGLIGGSQSAS